MTVPAITLNLELNQIDTGEFVVGSSLVGGTDTLPVDTIQWNGTNVATPDAAGHPKVTIKTGTGAGELSLSSGLVRVDTPLKRNTALNNYHFLMTDSTNHAPAAGLTVSATRAIDNGSFGAGTLSSVTEIANGIYRINLAAGDTNGTVITLRFTASGADDLFVTLLTEP
jgi:hypothetical protein